MVKISAKTTVCITKDETIEIISKKIDQKLKQKLYQKKSVA